VLRAGKRFENTPDLLYSGARSLRLESVLRRDPAANTCRAARSTFSFGEIPWNYDRVEILADGVVHGTGIVLALIGTIALLAVTIKLKPMELAPASIYSFGLLAMLGISAAYNLWPVSPTKWLLRRFDHSAIYLLVAATYMPFLSLLQNGFAWAVLTAAIWSMAFVGALLKLTMPGRFDRLSIVLYLLMGWSGLMAYKYFAAVLPGRALALLLIGGIFYSLGTVFHVWENLRFQNVVWHGFVLIAASCHYSAVLACLAAA
jgi:hemolysin III